MNSHSHDKTLAIAWEGDLIDKVSIIREGQCTAFAKVPGTKKNLQVSKIICGALASYYLLPLDTHSFPFEDFCRKAGSWRLFR